MIEKVYTDKFEVLNSTSSPLFLVLAILLTLEKHKKVSYVLLQIYVWGLQNDYNRNQLVRWRISQQIHKTPWLCDLSISSVISQCISSNILTTEITKQGKTSIVLGAHAYSFLAELKNLDIAKEIDANLNSIGRLTETMLNNYCFDF